DRHARYRPAAQIERVKVRRAGRPTSPPARSLIELARCGAQAAAVDPSVENFRSKEVELTGTLEKAWGYQGDNLNLPVRDLAASLPFYEKVLGFRVLSRSSVPHNQAVLARDEVQIGLAENGGDSTQDGCAFHARDLDSLFSEFKGNGLNKELSSFD